jgi:hypothetical protein
MEWLTPGLGRLRAAALSLARRGGTGNPAAPPAREASVSRPSPAGGSCSDGAEADDPYAPTAWRARVDLWTWG